MMRLPFAASGYRSWCRTRTRTSCRWRAIKRVHVAVMAPYVRFVIYLNVYERTPDPMDELFSVADKIVVVTGGMGQLGRQYSLALEARGARVAVLDLVVEDAAVRERFPDSDRFMFCAVDVTQRASLEAALAEIESAWGTPQVLINNAALDSPPSAPASENGPFETYPEDSFDRVMDVNVKGVFLCCQVFGGAMANAGRGSIINIGSIYGTVSPNQRIYEYRAESGPPFFKPVAYSVSKSALANLTRYLATYWAGKGGASEYADVGGRLQPAR